MYVLNNYIVVFSIFVLFNGFLNTSVSAFFLTPWLQEKLFSESSPNIPKYIQEPNKKQFFGIIGPNVLPENVKNLFDLFTGDGVIQGIFING